MLVMKRMAEDAKAELLKTLCIDNPAVFVYEAVERGSRIGYAVFEKTDEKVIVTRAEYGGDLDLLDGLIRAGMAWMDDNGLQTLWFDITLKQADLKQLWFITDDKNSVDSVGEFLKSCKKCRM